MNCGAVGIYLWKVDAEGVHVHPIEKARKTLIEPAEAFVHQLQVHEVGFQVGHGVGKLSKGRLE